MSDGSAGVRHTPAVPGGTRQREASAPAVGDLRPSTSVPRCKVMQEHAITALHVNGAAPSFSVSKAPAVRCRRFQLVELRTTPVARPPQAAGCWGGVRFFRHELQEDA